MTDISHWSVVRAHNTRAMDATDKAADNGQKLKLRFWHAWLAMPMCLGNSASCHAVGAVPSLLAIVQ